MSNQGGSGTTGPPGTRPSRNAELARRIAELEHENAEALRTRDARLRSHDAAIAENTGRLNEVDGVLARLAQTAEMNTARLGGHDTDLAAIGADLAAHGDRLEVIDGRIATLARSSQQNADCISVLTRAERRNRVTGEDLGIAAFVGVILGFIGYFVGQWMVGGAPNVKGQPDSVVKAVVAEWATKMHKGHLFGFLAFLLFGFFLALFLLRFLPDREDRTDEVPDNSPPRAPLWQRMRARVRRNRSGAEVPANPTPTPAQTATTQQLPAATP